jgi:hypothetical protein
MLIQQMGGKNALQEAVVSPLEQNGWETRRPSSSKLRNGSGNEFYLNCLFNDAVSEENIELRDRVRSSEET